MHTLAAFSALSKFTCTSNRCILVANNRPSHNQGAVQSYNNLLELSTHRPTSNRHVCVDDHNPRSHYRGTIQFRNHSSSSQRPISKRHIHVDDNDLSPALQLCNHSSSTQRPISKCRINIVDGDPSHHHYGAI